MNILCMLSLRDIVIAAVSVAATLLATQVIRDPRKHVTTSGRAKAVAEKAFVLEVKLDFQDEATAKELMDAWAQAAAWCLENEPFLYHYEWSKSDKRPLSYLIYERYRSKDDYVNAHRSSPAFHRFRPRMRALQASERVKVTGDSFVELGVGFT